MKKKLWVIAAAVMLCCMMFAVGVSAATEGDYTYTVTDGKATITDARGISDDITIPSTLGGYPVTEIGESAFDYCTYLTSITIPSGVTSIGDSAFYNCTSLTSITIPSSATSIGDYAFSACRSLTSITIPRSVTSIGDSAFSGCESLTSITIPSGVTSIGDSAFSGCRRLTNITIPSGVTSIGGSAFYNCLSLTSITIPSSVTYIGKSAFDWCASLTSITIPDGVISIGYLSFGHCKSLTSITIPDSVTSIGSDAFRECLCLTSIIIPDSVTSIGSYAFFSCTSLTSITIPNSVTSIGKRAFGHCKSLTNITIPNSVTSIGEEAFSSCNNLTIYGCSGTYAQTYATQNSIPFVALAAALTPTFSNSEYFLAFITTYCTVGESVSFFVPASVTDGGTLTYQWYISDTADGAGTAIPGATTAEYTFTATEIGTKYCFLIVTNTNSLGSTASAESAVRQIIVNPKVDAQMPTIFAQTDSLSVPVGESAALFVSASVSDGGTLTYQWYVSDTETGDGTEIPGATDAGYRPSTAAAGTAYYYVIITNTNANATGLQTASVKSAVMELTVGAKKLYTISGALITYGDAADVTIELLLNGEVIRTVPVADTTGTDTYSIDGVEAGTYTLRVSKPRHVTREYTVTVGQP